MGKFNYDNIFLIGERQSKELLFMEIDAKNFSFSYIITSRFTLKLEELKKRIKSLDKERICNIIDFLDDDGLESILDGGDFGNNILSEVYRDFFLYTIDQREITVFTKIEVNTYNFDDIRKYYDKGKFDNILLAIKFKNSEWLEEQIKKNVIYDDIEDFLLEEEVEEEEEVLTNKISKENLFKLFCEFLESQNIKF